jgi:hypothetical protein
MMGWITRRADSDLPTFSHFDLPPPARPQSVGEERAAAEQRWLSEAASTLGPEGVAEVRPKRFLDESPWLQCTSECQRL